jgi:ribosome-binding protein aMBF1 (putative translation factor)
MASTRIKLDPETVEKIARRVVEILERRGLQQRELVDAAELARRFGIERS